MNPSKKKIMVCANCLRASCYYGEFYCEDYKTANTTIKTIGELRKLKLENSDYWKSETLQKVYGDPIPFGYSTEKE